MEKIGRRSFNFIIGLWLLSFCVPAGCRKSPNRSTDPRKVLNDLSNNEVIGRLRKGELIFVHKSLEGLKPNGKEALAIIQRGLISLDLMKSIEEYEYGVYGPKTEKAVRFLQNWAGIDRVQGWDGRKFEASTLEALEKALQEKIKGHWDAQKIKVQISNPESSSLFPAPREFPRPSLLLSIFQDKQTFS